MSESAKEDGDRRALVLGPLALPGLVFVVLALARRRPLFVFVGAVLVGRAVKLVDREHVKRNG